MNSLDEKKLKINKAKMEDACGMLKEPKRFQININILINMSIGRYSCRKTYIEPSPKKMIK